MTSNLGSVEILNEKDSEKRELQVNEVLNGHFRPEFLNRIDEKIIFDRLTEKDISEIVMLQLENLKQKLREKSLEVEFSDDAIMQISSEGYDPIYGARPLKRTIQKNILDPLSRSIINEEFKNGDIIMVSIGSEGLEFNNK